VFLASAILLNSYKVTASEVLVEIDAIVPSNDIFQLFYQQEGMNSFTEKKSLKNNIIGNQTFQKIRFNIPLDKTLTAIRIDIGNNKEQKVLKIKDVKLIALKKTLLYSIKDDFIPNKFIDFDDKRIKSQVVNNRYDPYFLSTFDVKNSYENLIQEQSGFNKKIIILLSSIISIILFISLYYNETKIKSLYSSSYIVFFMLILISPIFVKTFNIDISSSVSEKRKLVTKPEFELTKKYPQKYEQYYNDNFGLRTMFVNWNSKIKLDYFKVSPNPEAVLFGKNGFLFYNKTDIYNSYSNKDIAQEQVLAKALEKQINLRNKLEVKGIKYVVGFLPNKHTIYKEHLPFSMKMQVSGDTTLADQLVSYFKENSFPFVDLRKDLLSAKSKNQLYHKFDTHWNFFGAYVGYTSFCKQTFETLKLIPYDVNYFNIEYSEKRNGDLTNMIGLKEMESYYDTIPTFILKDKEIGYINLSNEGFPKRTIVTFNKNCSNKETALVFRDSYTKWLIPFLSLHYRKVIYIWQYPVNTNLVEKYNPDVVMSLSVERALTHLK